ncbi:cellulase family glycosylhydrolase [Anaerolineales bacterium]
MRKHFNHKKNLIWAFALLLIGIAACAPQTAIPIYVTPTQQIVPTISTVVPTVEIIATEPNLSPTVEIVTTVTPETTRIGAIIDSNYIVPPTTTPRLPTQVATEVVTQVAAIAEPSSTPIPIPQAPGGLDPNLMGIQVDYNATVDQWAQILNAAKMTKVGWIKLQANWQYLQSNHRDQFDQNFALFQLHVQEAHKQELKVLLSIAKAPTWTRNVNRNFDGPPDNPADLVYFINLLLEKVGPNVDAIEIWNEPNLDREWTGNYPRTGAGYMQLFKPAYEAIRAYSPDITIVTAGLAPVGNVEGATDDREFLQGMYNAGLGQYPDVAVGIHPYSWGNPPDVSCCDAIPDRGWDDNPRFFFSDNIKAYHDILIRNGQSTTKLWGTEFGWATWDSYPSEVPEAWMTYNTPLTQAEHTLKAFEIAQSLEYMGPMILWNLNFANPTVIEMRNEIAGYSLLYPNYWSGEGTLERPLFWSLVQRP